MDSEVETQPVIDERQDRQVRAVEHVLGWLLRWGVNASLALIVLGSILNFSKPSGYGATAADLHHLTDPEAVFPRTAEWICSGLRHLDGQAIIVLGLATLIATPVMRVAVSILAFVYQRDRTFALITSTVLALLILSFLLGKAAG